MRRFIFGLMLFACIVNTGCKKSDLETTPLEDVQPAVTEIGTPTSGAVSKTIGTAGGTISSADGRIDVLIPAGAVTATTAFSIQPISNQCPNGRNAFRLLPSGTVFTNPVTITFHYTEEDTQSTLPELLGIAYQDTNHIWYRIPSANINTIDKTISVKAKHFTDWSDMEGIKMSITSKGIATNQVKINEQLALSIEATNDAVPSPASAAPNNPSPDDEDLPPLPKPSPKTIIWRINQNVNGNAVTGTITPADPSLGVFYKYMSLFTAPAEVPSPDTVTVSATLKGFKWKSRVNGRDVSFNEVIVPRVVRVIGAEYNYAVTVEFKDNNITGYNGQLYTDKATFDMNVKVINDSAVISLSNIENQNATVVPEVQLYPLDGSSITFTWIHDAATSTTGYINITDAYANSYSAQDTMLDLRFVHKDATNVKFEWLVITGSGSLTGRQGGETLPDGVPDGMLMKLVNREQIFRQENGMGIYIKFTPK